MRENSVPTMLLTSKQSKGMLFLKKFLNAFFKEIFIKSESDEDTLEYGLDELKRVFEIADNFIKKGKGSKGTLRRNLTKQLEKHGAQMTGMRMKICNELLREGMKTYGAIQQSAEKCEDSEDDYSELIEEFYREV